VSPLPPTLICKIIRTTWTGGVPEAVERLLCECVVYRQSPEFKPQSYKKKKKALCRMFHLLEELPDITALSSLNADNLPKKTNFHFKMES
jgi:hypothetical protein